MFSPHVSPHQCIFLTQLQTSPRLSCIQLDLVVAGTLCENKNWALGHRKHASSCCRGRFHGIPAVYRLAMQIFIRSTIT